ncbi:MAG TPA: amidohydrolase family protein [Acidimicrobiales bacterium]|nr:amidohydrolase family protein [Acidimicrobiales bacterium]
MLDLVIRGGTVLDGTGAPARPADVGVADGRVTTVGEVDEPAARTLVADGLCVAPGFVDLHTHYDAQLLWDGDASPSPLHGVTTVIGGNCGFSLAPAGPDDAVYLTRMMAKVEGMSKRALEAGLDWEWRSFGDFLARLEGRLGVNAGFLVGHSTIRRSVMGDDAVRREATGDEVAAMVAALQRALGEGGLGLSTSTVHTHHDGDMEPVPSRSASRTELESLAAALADHPGTTLEMILQGCLTGFSPEEEDLMASLSAKADRPLNWNVLGVPAYVPGRIEHQLHASDVAAERGATVVALTLMQVMPVRITFAGGSLLEGLPGWREFLSQDEDEILAGLADPEVRRRLEEGAASDGAGILRARVANWPELTVEETFTPAAAPFEGRKVGDVAAEQGRSPFDTLVDIVVADRLRTGLRAPTPESDGDWVAGREVWRHPRAVLGGSDAGAHLDLLVGAVYSTAFLEGAVRKRGLISWEEAVALLADRPARLYGLKDRGRLVEGYAADVVVFDPETVGPGTEHTRSDLPAGQPRLYAGARGIEHVLVGGTEVVTAGEFTGERPGRVLRSGRDTTTVRAGAPW